MTNGVSIVWANMALPQSHDLQLLHEDTVEARNTTENNPTIENNIRLKAANATFRKNYLYAIMKS